MIDINTSDNNFNSRFKFTVRKLSQRALRKTNFKRSSRYSPIHPAHLRDIFIFFLSLWNIPAHGGNHTLELRTRPCFLHFLVRSVGTWGTVNFFLFGRRPNRREVYILTRCQNLKGNALSSPDHRE